MLTLERCSSGNDCDGAVVSKVDFEPAIDVSGTPALRGGGGGGGYNVEG